MTCVPNKELDGLIEDHITVKRLRIDSTLKGIKIGEFREIISTQDERNKVLNAEKQEQLTILNGYKKDYSTLQLKYTGLEKKASRRGKGVLILIGATIIATGIALLKP